jgi:hypothetical protein
MDTDVAFLFESGGTTYVAISLNSGFLGYTELPAPSDPGFTPELLVVNFDGGYDAAWVKIDRSLAAGAEVYAFYFLNEDCQVEDAGTVEVPRYEFLDWFGAAHSQGFRCTATGVIETLAGATETAGQWRVTTAVYEWTAPAAPGFVETSRTEAIHPEGSAEVSGAGIVDC